MILGLLIPALSGAAGGSSGGVAPSDVGGIIKNMMP